MNNFCDWKRENVKDAFNQAQVPMTESQLGERQVMEEVAEHMGMNYPDTRYSRYVAHLVKDFLFPREEAGSAENTITIVEDEDLSEIMTPPAP